MNWIRIIFCSTLCYLALAGNITAKDTSTSDKGPCITGVDGPYVFYKRDKVVVKNITFDKGQANIERNEFEHKTDITTLSCLVDDKKGTRFNIKLHSDYTIPPSVYPEPTRLFAISDIEGEFQAFTRTLIGNEVIDEKLNWSFGDGHLVLVGDFFDRGYNVTAVLWLIYELERQAKEVGGMVHFIIGNHEEMNLRGDTRYVKEKYLQTAKAFKMSYTGLYSKNTELGRWIRSKNTIEKIGRTLFVHGGISPELADARFRIEEINKISRKFLGQDKWKIQQRGGNAKVIFNEYGPMWYRGYFRDALNQQRLDYTLDIYGAKQVVVGHTVVPDVSSLYNDRVIGIDVKHEIAVEAGTSNALLIEDNRFFAVNVYGKRSPIYSLLCEDDVVGVLDAIRKNKPEKVSDFLARGKRINKYYTKKAYTLLHFAIKHNRIEIVNLLLEKGANIEQNVHGKTPLMYAIKLKHHEITNVLLKKGADVNAANSDKKTPLIYCAEYGNLQIAKSLIQNGAKLEHRDEKGRTAADYATKKSKPELAHYLRSL